MLERGIHTFALYHKCSYSELQNLIEMLHHTGHCWKIKSDAANINRTHFSSHFAKQGVLLYIFQRLKGKSGIILRVTPCTVLGKKYAATALYQPTESSYQKLEHALDKILKQLKLDFTADEMSICRVDPCANIFLTEHEMTSEYLRIVKKSGRINHYRLIQYEKGTKSVKDVKAANKHSHRISSKRASFTIYDKKFVLQQLDRCPADLLDKGVLRVEAELQREALLKRIRADKSWSNFKILQTAAHKASRILENYLQQMQTGTGRSL